MLSTIQQAIGNVMLYIYMSVANNKSLHRVFSIIGLTVTVLPSMLVKINSNVSGLGIECWFVSEIL